MARGGPVGRVVDGRFELGGRLGGGGMGLVWRARDLVLHREVALKEVRPPDPALAEYDPEGARMLRARVLREARALARLDHPNVVTVHHIVDADDGSYPWIVMELVRGGSLQDRLAKDRLEPAAAAAIGQGVLAALRAAHAAGIHHRDVKPANVLLRTDGRPVLTDFGIAAIRESTSLTATGALIGSPDFIAPERIRGHEGDPASDLWSLGMMLYVAVEGHHPLRKATTLATLAAVLDEEIPPPVRAGSLTPVLTALLNRDPSARPDAATVQEMLLAAVRGGATTVVPPGSGATAPVPSSAPPPSRPAAAAHGPGHTVRPLRPAEPAHGPVDAVPDTAVGFPGLPNHGPNDSQATAGRPDGPGTGSERARRLRNIAFSVSAASTVLAGVLLWQFIPDGSTSAGQPESQTPQPSGSQQPFSPQQPSPSVATEDPADKPLGNLLTPDAIRDVIDKLKPEMGGTEAIDFTVYKDSASAKAMVKGSKTLYDDFDYRDGQVTKDTGGEISDEVPVDLTKFDWNKVPALLKIADSSLGVDKPTSHYLIVEPNWVFADNQPTLLVYVSDEYGGAYLAADVHGKVLKKYPRE